MKVKVFVWIMMGCLSLLSCKKNQQNQLENDAKLMATLECEARHLKEERFEAANDIRLMEDSLAKNKIALTTLQSQEIDSIKKVYTLRTGQLADKITRTMDSLFAVNYQSSEQRQTFDLNTEKILQEICK